MRILNSFGLAIVAIAVAAPTAWAEGDHFHPKGKPASEHTIKVLDEARERMPFSDKKDFEENERGFIAAPESLIIKADAGHNAWDMERYQFLDTDEGFDSLHPSLHRQSKLNLNYGLYEVIPGIYQVRGFDLANITFVQGKEGWIVFDPATARETAKAALDLANEHLGERPVTAVIFSHSHGDHFGGVRGIVDEADALSGKVQIIVPGHGFMHHAVSENVYAGNAMSRRLFYQYGVLLPASPYGHAGQGLAQNVAAGNLGLLAPTRVIEDEIEELTVDGVKMIFQNTPGTEAPSEMNTYLPEMKAFWAAENVTGTIHNIYTLRGAQVRDALAWSKYINEALYLFGDEAEVMFASHHWPRWGNDRIQEVLRGQRDAYAHLHNQVLHYANQGVTINEIHNVYEVPQSLEDEWYARGYHGSPQHNSRAVINYYLGYWDANPATLIPLSPDESAPLYVEMMGGADKIMKRGKELVAEGKYRLAQEPLNKLVLAEPDNQDAKDLLADVFEQIGYQQENPGLRNSFLAGAYELRSGIPAGASPKTTGPDVIKAMSTKLFLDFLGIRMDSRKAEGMAFKINLITPDNDEKYVVEMSNATLTNIEGYEADDADLTITIDRTDLESVMIGEIPLVDQIDSGKAKATGDRDVLEKLRSTLVTFELGFEILPGTGGKVADVKRNPFEHGPLELSGE